MAISPARFRLSCALLAGLWAAGSLAGAASPVSGLAVQFATPQPSARPWVYWSWLSSNVTREGITADLEAMKRVGIGGALILDVENGTPPGDMKFFDPEWQEMFKHTVAEAKRLGMEISMNNGPGYFGSGGPWVPPEKAMQWIFTSETAVAGGQPWKGKLPEPRNSGAYRDIAVYAVPATRSAFKIQDFQMKALYWDNWVAYRGTQSAPANATAPADSIIPLDRVIDLTSKVQPDGTLEWNPPPGDWVVLRIGHAYNGRKVGPSPKDQTGAETDKLNRDATAFHFDTFVKRLSDITGPAMRPALVGTHIDSWEGGGQNWTAGMQDEFRKRRGYDPLPYLPIMSGRVLGDLQTTERFLWDLRKTVSELMVENYVAPFQQMARKQGLRFTFESYTTSGQDFDAANFVDEPMAEFWTANGQGADFYPTGKSMSSAAHLNGRAIVGAEAFTSGASEKWLWHPAMFKDIGDDAFTQGINRFVFHRYAAQRFDRRPGLQMGPWGLHYERTNTWWEWSGPWHAYVTRCQHLLRQGEFVADVLALQSEEPLLRFQIAPIPGYDYDACGSGTFEKVSVKEGCVVLPTGRSYQLLVLNHNGEMTVPTLKRIRDLVRSGAAVLGQPPQNTPGLTGLPQAEIELKALAEELWGAGASVADRRVGEGRVFRGIKPEEALARLEVAPDFISKENLRWIHRHVDGSDFYFVANPASTGVTATVSFRVSGRQPELWNAETGAITQAAFFAEKDGRTELRLRFEPKESVFVVFPKDSKPLDPVTGFACDGKNLLKPQKRNLLVEKASYGVPGDPARTRDVRETAQQLLEANPEGFPAGELAKSGDPAFGVVKTLSINYSIDGRKFIYTGKDTDRFQVASLPVFSPWVEYDRNGKLKLTAAEGGNYELSLKSGKKLSAALQPPAAEQTLTGSWQVRFDAKEFKFDDLTSWSDHPEPAVRYHSGTAVYQKTFSLTPAQVVKGQRLYLDLGKVEVMARVRINGLDLGILWKPPYRLDISTVAKSGANTLEVAVVNLWPNRLIGDEHLPEDSDRNKNGTLKSWPQWLLENKPSPTGRQTFSSWRLWKKEDPLQPSGLLGPVTLQALHHLEL